MLKSLPNILTLIRIFLIPVFIAVYYVRFINWNICATVIFIVAAITDWFDGYLARKLNVITDFGKLWDPVADKLLVLAALLVLMDWGKIGLIIVLIILTREFIISALRALAASKGVVIAADIIGKLKTVVQFISIIMLLIGGILNACGYVLIYISVILAIYSCIEYFIKNRKIFGSELSK